MAAAMDYMEEIGYDFIQEQENKLLNYAIAQLKAFGGIRFIGEADQRTSLVSFLLEGAHPYDVGSLLDQQGIARVEISSPDCGDRRGVSLVLQNDFVNRKVRGRVHPKVTQVGGLQREVESHSTDEFGDIDGCPLLQDEIFAVVGESKVGEVYINLSDNLFTRIHTGDREHEEVRVIPTLAAKLLCKRIDQ